jgi:regulator of sigma E protease
MAQNPSEVAPATDVAPTSDELRTPEEKRKVALTWVAVLGAIAIFSLRRPDVAYTILMFVITLSVLVFVHEWGHYQFGRWGGMKINRFAIGFPPFIYTKRKNNIDYSIGALPIGGMVDIAGLGSEEEMVATSKGQASPVAAPNPHKPHGQKNFQDATLGWRFMTLFAGPLMNFIFALVVFAAMFSLAGIPDKITVTNQVDVVQPYTPAFKAGLLSDDKIIGINDVRTTDNEKLRELIRKSNGEEITVVVQRGTQVVRLPMTPQFEEQEKADGTKERAPIIGIMFLARVDSYQRVGLLRGENGFQDSAVGLGLLQSRLLAESIFGLLRRAVTGQLTESDKRSVGGPVKIAQTVGHSVKRSWQEWVLLAGSLSVNLGLMNLLPIPALDGGRIMFILYEAIMRRPFDHRKESYVNAFGMIMVLTFMLFMTFRDVLPMLQKAF